MDVREFEFWAGEAERQKVRREIETLENVRLAMWAKGDDFTRLIQALQASIMTPVERKRQIEASWLQLRVIGRG